MNNNENPDDRDPYNFFKLSTEPEEGGDGDKNGKMRPRLPFWGLILIVLGVVAILNIFWSKSLKISLIFRNLQTKLRQATSLKWNWARIIISATVQNLPRLCEKIRLGASFCREQRRQIAPCTARVRET